MTEIRPPEPTDSRAAVAERLRAIMDATGLTPFTLASAVGAWEADVRDWLEGRILPPVPLINRLARLAGITLGFLYHGDLSGLLPGPAARLRMILERECPVCGDSDGLTRRRAPTGRP
jgi:transcriptional regulator with XRE-family HTH domain